MELKERLKVIRKECNMSQEKFAVSLGTTRPAIASYELGAVVPNDVFLQLVSLKFNLSFEWLKTGRGQMRKLLSREEELAEWLRKIYAPENETDEFASHILFALSKLNRDEWGLLAQIAEKIHEREIIAKKTRKKEKSDATRPTR